MIKIYHNPRCKVSREVLQLIQAKTNEIEIVEYTKNKLTIEELKNLCLQLNISPETMVRKNESFYKTHLKGKTFSDYEWFRIFQENTQLIERPIVINGYKAMICRPAEKVRELLDK